MGSRKAHDRLGYIVSILLNHLGFFDPGIPGLPVHGANLVTAGLVSDIAADPEVDEFEVFLPPAEMLDPAALERCAGSVLPPERRGRGILGFFPYHAIPDVWADGRPRVLMSVDPEWLARDRYLRDRFAAGPMPLICDTHALAYHRLWPTLQRYARAPHVPYDVVLCISVALREALARAFDGFVAPDGAEPPCRLEVVRHGVDIEHFRPVDDAGRAEARRLLRLPADGVIALNLGRATPRDKADLLPLLRSFARADAAPDARLVIAGNEGLPGYYGKLREAGDALGLGDRLILRPEVPPEMRTLYYAAADVFVFPGDTVQEGQGVTVAEAAASGLPIVISDWDGMRDMVTEGENGFRVPTWWMPACERTSDLSVANPLLTEYLYLSQMVWVDTEKLAQRLGELLHSPELRRRMGEASRRYAERELSTAVQRQRVNAICREMLDLAARETPAEAEERRGPASALGLPPPYMYLFEHYATGVLDPDRHAFRLSAAGRDVIAGRRRMQFYDELLPRLRQEVVDSVFAQLASAGAAWSPLRALTEAAARKTGRPEDEIRFLLGLLLKQGLVEFTGQD